jgi:hypothetical protein
MKRLLSTDPLTGITQHFHVDKDTGAITIETNQDITAIVERNKALQNEQFDKRSEMWPVATVPMTILIKWANEAGVEMNSKAFGEVVKKKLNDPDFKAFRTGVFKF